jgi:hypothetical protein
LTHYRVDVGGTPLGNDGRKPWEDLPSPSAAVHWSDLLTFRNQQVRGSSPRAGSNFQKIRHTTKRSRAQRVAQ